MKVVHCKREVYDVYIGRPSKWGNPFLIGQDGTREEVIQKYREWIQTQYQLLKSLGELRGKILGCWCSPKPCHGEVLIQLVEGMCSWCTSPRSEWLMGQAFCKPCADEFRRLHKASNL